MVENLESCDPRSAPKRVEPKEITVCMPRLRGLLFLFAYCRLGTCKSRLQSGQFGCVFLPQCLDRSIATLACGQCDRGFKLGLALTRLRDRL